MVQLQPVDKKGSDKVFQINYIDTFQHNFCNKDVSIVTKSSNKTKIQKERKDVSALPDQFLSYKQY